MLSFLTILSLAQASPIVPVAAPKPKLDPLPVQEILRPQEAVPTVDSQFPPMEILQLQEVRPLPGDLDDVPVVNSNSPEVVKTEGILLSTFPGSGKAFPNAHLNVPLEGRFDIFSHHISRAENPAETRSLFQGLLVFNPTRRPITLNVLQGASYLTRPDALFVELPDYVDDPLGTVYSGPGSRAMNDVLRGRLRGGWPAVVTIPPGESYMLMNLPIPAGKVTPTSNGRSTLLRLRSNGPVYVASLAMFAPQTPNKTERIPTVTEWENLIRTANLAGPRDIPPTTPGTKTGQVIYGRVAGVAKGSLWKAQLTDSAEATDFTIPQPGQAISYGLSLLERGTLGTGQIQSAPMVARYADTAYLANGNYGIEYSLTLPLHNAQKTTQTVAIALQTPLKEEQIEGGLLFFDQPPQRIFFRGPVRVRYNDDQNRPQTRFVHIVQRRGQRGEPLVKLTLPPDARRLVHVDFLYPPDATPPQVLTVETLAPGS